MTQLIENDTDTEKSGRAPSTSTCCLLIAARRQVKGFPGNGLWLQRTLVSLPALWWWACSILVIVFFGWFLTYVSLSHVLIFFFIKSKTKENEINSLLISYTETLIKNTKLELKVTFSKATCQDCHNHIDHHGILKSVLSLNLTTQSCLSCFLLHSRRSLLKPLLAGWQLRALGFVPVCPCSFWSQLITGLESYNGKIPLSLLPPTPHSTLMYRVSP